MTDQSAANRSDGSVKQGFAAGTSIAAAILLLTVGILEIFQGISALAKDDVLVFGPNYTYEFSVTAWGWIHLVIGILVALTGFFLLTGATWARITAIFLAALSIIANFLWPPCQDAGCGRRCVTSPADTATASPPPSGRTTMRPCRSTSAAVPISSVSPGSSTRTRCPRVPQRVR